MREKAAEAIILPLAQEVGLPFTLEELKEYEQEQVKNMTLSEDELEQVAGGSGCHGHGRKCRSKGKPLERMLACAFIGVGIGMTSKNKKNKCACFIIGGSTGPVTEKS